MPNHIIKNIEPLSKDQAVMQKLCGARTLEQQLEVINVSLEKVLEYVENFDQSNPEDPLKILFDDFDEVVNFKDQKVKPTLDTPIARASLKNKTLLDYALDWNEDAANFLVKTQGFNIRTADNSSVTPQKMMQDPSETTSITQALGMWNKEKTNATNTASSSPQQRSDIANVNQNDHAIHVLDMNLANDDTISDLSVLNEENNINSLEDILKIIDPKKNIGLANVLSYVRNFDPDNPVDLLRVFCDDYDIVRDIEHNDAVVSLCMPIAANNNETLLHYAAKHNENAYNFLADDMLFEIDAEDNSGRTPEQLMAIRNHLQLAPNAELTEAAIAENIHAVNNPVSMQM